MGIPGRIGTTRPFAEIARGTTTSVYKAYDEDADGIVAVKLLHQQWLTDAALASRFLAETDALRSVSDEHVVSILQSGESEAGLFIVTEYVEGATLGALLQQRTVPSAFALLAVRGAAAGLAAAHKEGIVHRDFKPANIIVGDSGVVKLADFGLAGTTQGKSRTATVAGTPDYLAPEVVAGHPATVASDVFSIGVSLFEALAGGLPVEQLRGPKSATFQIARAGDALLAALDEDERELVRVLTSALPEDRPDDASATLQLIDALISRFEPTPDAKLFGDWLSQTGTDAAVAVPRRVRNARVVVASPASTVVDPVIDRTPAKQRRGPLRMGVAATVFLVLASAAIVAWRSTRPAAPDQSPAADSTVEPIADSRAEPTESPGAVPGSVPDTVLGTTSSTASGTVATTPPSPPAASDNATSAASDTSNLLAVDTDEPADNGTTAAPDPLPASNQQAFLAVAASPWAEVLIDGVPFGTTPIGRPVVVDPGPREVVLRHPDFPDYVQRIDAVAADTVSLNVSMWSTVARLNLTVSPWAVVMIDETVRDTTPMRSDLIVRPGPTNLTLIHPTLGSWSTALDLKADSTYMMRYNLFELTRQ